MDTGELRGPVRERAEQSVPADTLFEVLSNRRRRLAIQVLREADSPMDIGTLATQIAARENDIDPAAVTHRQRKSVYTALHQNHLPKLTDAGFVTADREWVRLRLTDRASLLESHLHRDESRRSRPLWQVALATGLSTTAVVAFVPGSNLPTVGVTLTVTVCATLVCYWLFAERPPSIAA